MGRNCMGSSAPITLEQARAAKSAAASLFTKIGKVVGVGITRIGSGYGVKVNLSATPRAVGSVPDEVDGVPIQVEVVGDIRKR
jgi:hypothetical protein